MAETRVPTWRLRESLKRTAEDHIQGRKNFEEHTGRVSTKPLTQITLDPTEVLQLLADSEPVERIVTNAMVNAAQMALVTATGGYGPRLSNHTVRRMIEAALKED